VNIIIRNSTLNLIQKIIKILHTYSNIILFKTNSYEKEICLNKSVEIYLNLCVSQDMLFLMI